jgi:hypothetical protein
VRPGRKHPQHASRQRLRGVTARPAGLGCRGVSGLSGRVPGWAGFAGGRNVRRGYAGPGRAHPAARPGRSADRQRNRGKGFPLILSPCPGVSARRPVDDVGHKSSRLVANAASGQPLLLLVLTADGSEYLTPIGANNHVGGPDSLAADTSMHRLLQRGKGPYTAIYPCGLGLSRPAGGKGSTLLPGSLAACAARGRCQGDTAREHVALPVSRRGAAADVSSW